MLILDCPNLDDDNDDHHLRKATERTKSSDRDERKPRRKEVKPRSKSPPTERPVSITVKLNTTDFDLRQLIKKRRTEESSSTAQERLVHIGSNDNHLVVHKPIDHHHQHRLSSRRTEKNSKR